MTFAIITPALITGATADRMKFGAYAAVHRHLAAWSSTRRSPTGCSAAAGWPKMGALDFAGGAVVHINAGAAALALILVLGRRQGLAPRGDAPALAAADPARHRHPVVRVVRVQRRLGAGRETGWPRRPS